MVSTLHCMQKLGIKGSLHNEQLQYGSLGRDAIAAIKYLVVVFMLLSWGWSCKKLLGCQ